MQTLLAFVVAVGLLVLLHEWGHYRVARACGVRVLRFSIGFGRPLWRWQLGQTEFVLAAIPLGGYVRMLESPAAAAMGADPATAFDRQRLLARSAIVLAGPLVNLLVAIPLFALSAWWGLEQPQALLDQPPVSSVAAAAGIRAGDRVLAAGQAGAERPTPTWPDLQVQLAAAAARQQALVLLLQRRDGSRSQVELAPAAAVGADAAAAALGLQLLGPVPRVAGLESNGPAQRAGMRPGDLIVAVDGQPVETVAALRRMVQRSQGRVMQLRVHRDGASVQLQLQAQRLQTPDAPSAQWRIGVLLDGSRPMQLRRLGPVPALREGLRMTLTSSWLTLRGFVRMFGGGSALHQLGGPVTMAEVAGRSAALGIAVYLQFLALLSVSLGVLNLLPIPVLDGGHLLYHALEALLGRPLQRPTLERLQGFGMACIALLMGIALFNDFTRLIGLFH